MAQDLMNNGMPLKHILMRWNQKMKLDLTFHPLSFTYITYMYQK